VANDIGAGVNAKLLSTAAIKALVADRGYPDVLPQDVMLPAYTFTLISDVPSHHLGGISGLSEARVQVDCYAATRTIANQLAEAVRIAIDGQRGTFGSEAVRTCHLESVFSSAEQPVDASDKWRYVTTQDYLVWYVQSTS
jgi:hypothetical protein